MKYFFEQEAKIVDLITNNLQFIVMPPDKAGECVTYKATIIEYAIIAELRKILNEVYEQGDIK